VFDESDIGYGKADEEKTRSVVHVCNMFVQYPSHAPAWKLLSQEWYKYKMYPQKHLGAFRNFSNIWRFTYKFSSGSYQWS